MTSPVDVHIGARVRRKRTAVGFSLSQMSALLGVSERRLLAYEAGATRVAAGDLAEIARLLGERPSWFFSGLPSADARIFDGVADGSADGLELMRIFVGVKDPAARRQIFDLVAGFARAESEGHPAPKSGTGHC